MTVTLQMHLLIISVKLARASVKIRIVIFDPSISVDVRKYVGDPFLSTYKFDAELIERVSCKMERGKAAGLDELTVEHVVHSHPVLIIIMVELLNLVMSTAHVPYGFRRSYTVPLPKEDIGCMKNSVNNYRASLYLLALCCRKYLNSVY